MNEKRIVEQGYDKIAEEYCGWRRIFKNIAELEEFAALLPKSAKVLDIGCGAGIPAARFLVERGCQVVGIDFSEKMLDLARANVSEAEFLKKDMTELDFENDSFDALTAFYSIIHVPRTKHVGLFQAFHRILKPGGLMLISLGSDAWEGTDDFHGVQMFWSHYTPEKSLQFIKHARFDIIFDRCVEEGGEAHYWVLAKKV